MGQSGNVGGHAPPPALAEPQPRRALLRCCADQGTLGEAPKGTREVWEGHPRAPARSARAATCSAGCVCHHAASTGPAAGAGALALPPSAQGRGAEVRGGCPVPLGAVAAAPWARQVRGDWHACAGRPAKLTTAGRASGPCVRGRRSICRTTCVINYRKDSFAGRRIAWTQNDPDPDRL